MAMPHEVQREYGTIASRFMDTVGDGTGSIDMNVNGSVTPVTFKVTAAANELLIVNRAIIFIKDSGSLDADSYGNGLALTNGITGSVIKSDATEIPMFGQHPVKTNGDWAAYCYDIADHSFGIGDSILSARYTFTRDGGPIGLMPGDSLEVYINDDLTGLTGHHIRLGMVSVPV